MYMYIYVTNYNIVKLIEIDSEKYAYSFTSIIINDHSYRVWLICPLIWWFLRILDK